MPSMVFYLGLLAATTPTIINSARSATVTNRFSFGSAPSSSVMFPLLKSLRPRILRQHRNSCSERPPHRQLAPPPPTRCCLGIIQTFLIRHQNVPNTWQRRHINGTLCTTFSTTTLKMVRGQPFPG